MSRKQDAQSVKMRTPFVFNDTGHPRDSNLTALHNPKSPICCRLSVRTGIFGEKVQPPARQNGRPHRLQHLLSQDSNSVVPIDAVRGEREIHRGSLQGREKKRPRAQTATCVQVTFRLLRLSLACTYVSNRFMQYALRILLRRAATSSMTARTTRRTSRPKTERRLARLSWVLL
jgi:hypothetical protein